MITMDEMFQYGYTYQNMFPVGKDDALAFFKDGRYELFRLYTNNTEAAIENEQEIYAHAENGGIFGIEDVAKYVGEAFADSVDGDKTFYTVEVGDGKYVDVAFLGNEEYFYIMENEDGSEVYGKEDETFPAYPYSQKIAILAASVKYKKDFHKTWTDSALEALYHE